MRFGAAVLAFACFLGIGAAGRAQDVRWLVEPRFADAGAGFEGVIPLFDGERWGLMGADGRWVRAPEFEALGRSLGARIAARKNGRWGAVDATGADYLPFAYDELGPPGRYTPARRGAGWVALRGGGPSPTELPLLIDTLRGSDGGCITGQREGRAVLDNMRDDKGAVETGAPVPIGAPSEGLATYTDGGLQGLVSCETLGLATAAAFERIRAFDGGMAAALQGGRWGYIGPDGAWAIAPRFAGARDFSGAYAPVQFASGKWGYIDRKGATVVEGRFDDAYSFAGGLAGVRVGDARGFLSEDTLSLVVPPQFEDFWRPTAGMAPVRLGGKWGIVAVGPVAGPPPPDLPAAALAPGAGKPPPRTVPSVPHRYFAQDTVSLHSLFVDEAAGLMLTALDTDLGGGALGGGNELGLWDLGSHRLVRKIPEPLLTHAVALPGGQTLVVARDDGTLAFRDAASGGEKATVRAFEAPVIHLAVSPGGAHLAATDGSSVAVWRLADGAALGRVPGRVEKLRFSDDGAALMGVSASGAMARWRLPDLAETAATAPVRPFPRDGFYGETPRLDIGPDGTGYLARAERIEGQGGGFTWRWRLEAITPSGPRALPLPEGLTDLLAVAISPDGRRIAVSGRMETSDHDALVVLDVRSGAVVASHALGGEGAAFGGRLFAVDRMLFREDGTMVLVGLEGDDILLADPVSGAVIDVFGAPLAFAEHTAADIGGTKVYAMRNTGVVDVFDMAAGRLVATRQLVSTGYDSSVAMIDGRLVIRQWEFDIADTERAIQVFDAESFAPVPVPDAEARRLDGILQGPGDAPQLDQAFVDRFAARGIDPYLGTFYAGGSRVVFSQATGAHVVYDTATGEELATFFVTRDGEWLMLTPEGFFEGSENGGRIVSVADGIRAFSVDQVFQALYRPDLVREKLKGDPAGRVAAAASELDLAAVVRSGGAPRVRIVAPAPGSAAGDPAAVVTAEIEGTGGGIGRIEWRVNGRTSEVAARAGIALGGKPAADAGASRVSARLPLDPGENLVEVVAYNASGLVASVPASLRLRWNGVASSSPPALWVLAAGVNDYDDGRLRLAYAAADARALAEGLATAGGEVFGAVHTRLLLDGEVTRERLDAAFSELGAEVQPQDVFVFFLAGHGKTVEGRYHFLPADFRFRGERPVRDGGIDQDLFQEWTARIPARKSVMIFDTCESGSLTSAAMRGLEVAAEQSAAVERLTRATGRTILSASTDDEPALEGYRGHGVLTYALLEAFDAGDRDGSATLEVTELAAYIDAAVPEISQAAFGLRQVPQMSIRGSDFALGRRTGLLGGGGERYPEAMTHVVAGGTEVLDAPGGAPVMAVAAGGFFGVYLVERTSGDWALVARDGKALGYVPAAALAPLQ